MRAFALLLAAAAVLAAVATTFVLLTALARRRGRRALRAARWQSLHYGRDGRTVVAVGLVPPGGGPLEEHVVDRIPDADPDWTGRFLRAREIAEERAFHLNSGGTAPPPG